MRHEFTAVYERDAEWIVAYCPEVPGANGQGRTKAEARESLAEAIAQMGARFLRYPGGEKSDSYLWSVPPYSHSQPTLARWASACRPCSLKA